MIVSLLSSLSLKDVPAEKCPAKAFEPREKEEEK